MSGTTRTNLVIEDDRYPAHFGQIGVIQKIIVAQSWSAVNAYQRREIRLQVSTDAVICLEGPVYGVVVERREAFVCIVQGGCCGHLDLAVGWVVFEQVCTRVFGRVKVLGKSTSVISRLRR